MIHIIGLAHPAQSRNPDAQETPAQLDFIACLTRTIEAVRPAFVGEEDSREALADRHQDSIAETICNANGIEHRFCDPTQQERQDIGYRDGQQLEIELYMRDDQGLSNDEIHLKARAIERRHYFPIRERFWIGRLEGCRERDSIFICGEAHIETFTQQLDGVGIDYRIVVRGIGVTGEQYDDTRRIVQYLEAHPELGRR